MYRPARAGTFPQEKEREERNRQFVGVNVLKAKHGALKLAGAPSKGSLPKPKVFNFWLDLHAFLFWSVPSAKFTFHNKFLGVIQLPIIFNMSYKSD